MSWIKDVSRKLDDSYEQYKLVPESQDFQEELYGSIKQLTLGILRNSYLGLLKREPDIATQITTNLFLKAPEFRGNSKFSTFIMTLINREAINEIRRQLSLDSVEVCLEEVASIKNRAVESDEELKIFAKEFLGLLDANDRKIFELTMDGYTIREIAKTMRLDYSFIQRRLKDIRNLAREQER